MRCTYGVMSEVLNSAGEDLGCTHLWGNMPTLRRLRRTWHGKDVTPAKYIRKQKNGKVSGGPKLHESAGYTAEFAMHLLAAWEVARSFEIDSV